MIFGENIWKNGRKYVVGEILGFISLYSKIKIFKIGKWFLVWNDKRFKGIW